MNELKINLRFITPVWFNTNNQSPVDDMDIHPDDIDLQRNLLRLGHLKSNFTYVVCTLCSWVILPIIKRETVVVYVCTNLEVGRQVGQ